MGHENVGEVVARRPERQGRQDRRRRLVYPWIGCGKCVVCKRGEENLCLKPCFIGVFRPGGYADHLHRAASALPVRLSALLARAGRAARLFRRHRLWRAEEIGAPLQDRAGRDHRRRRRRADGLALLKAMKGKGAIVVDIDPAKREAAKKAGALAAIDGNAPDAVAADPGRGQGGVWAVVDFVGSSATGEARHRQHDQGRQGGRGRPVRRRCHHPDAVHPDQGDDAAGLLCRQPRRR